ncbi:MAG: hypothetical protein ACYC7F_09695, partial [Gemmatimonadaceae bacterium]
LMLAVTGCASNSVWFHAGPRPPELVGMWIDVEKTTAADTVVWLLGVGGDDRTLHLRVVRDTSGEIRIKREDRRYGSWYLSGALSDTGRRAMCFKKRPRDGATCRQFRLDTIPGPPVRRRLTVLGYPGEQRVSARVLVERLPN